MERFAMKHMVNCAAEEKGQALIEYVLLTWLGILMAGGAIMIFPDMLKAVQTYFDNYYFVLNMPFP